jgi:hypothetical protein
MDLLIGTEGGLFRLAPDGRTTQLLRDPIRHVVAADEGAVALDASGTLWSVDDTVMEFDEFPAAGATCVLQDEDTVWIGTEGARLLRVRDGEAERVRAFDALPGRESWSQPGGGPPAVRSIDIDDDGVLYVAVHVGGVWRSVDGGETWLPGLRLEEDVHQVCTVPDYAQTVVAACATGMAISIDAGETWEVDTAGLHSTYARAIAVAGDHVVMSAADGPGAERSGLFRRALDGTIFARCRNGLPAEWWTAHVDTHCLVAWDEFVAAGVGDGTVWVSDDAGEKWRQLAAGLPRITAVAIP